MVIRQACLTTFRTISSDQLGCSVYWLSYESGSSAPELSLSTDGMEEIGTLEKGYVCIPSISIEKTIIPYHAIISILCTAGNPPVDLRFRPRRLKHRPVLLFFFFFSFSFSFSFLLIPRGKLPLVPFAIPVQPSDKQEELSGCPYCCHSPQEMGNVVIVVTTISSITTTSQRQPV